MHIYAVLINWFTYFSTVLIGSIYYSFAIQNTFGTSGPAVAMRVAGDRAAFYGCRFVSFQDTLLDDTGRHYYRGCYVQGGTDFIFGNGKALFDVRT